MKSIVVSGYAYPSIEQWVLEAWLPDLTFLGNFSYGITADGGVIDLADEGLTANLAEVRKTRASLKSTVQPQPVPQNIAKKQ